MGLGEPLGYNLHITNAISQKDVVTFAQCDPVGPISMLLDA